VAHIVQPRFLPRRQKKGGTIGAAEFREETSKKGRQLGNAGLLLRAQIASATPKRKRYGAPHKSKKQSSYKGSRLSAGR
jgi:hypothetical protein